MLKQRLKERLALSAARMKRPKFWLLILSLALVTSIVISIVALVGLRSVVEPPAAGEFNKLLQQAPIEEPNNATGTLFENTVDELSGGVIPVLLFPNMTKFCGDDSEFDLHIAACVDRFDATYIAVSEEFVNHLYEAYEDADSKGLTEEAEAVNQWERHLAAHEFGHILQYNYRTVTLPFQDNFEDGYIGGKVEDMAECYAQLRYPITDDVAEKRGDSVGVEFYGFSAKENFGLCTEDQLDTIREWLAAIPYPETDRVTL